jgi:hypothetical protein
MYIRATSTCPVRLEGRNTMCAGQSLEVDNALLNILIGVIAELWRLKRESHGRNRGNSQPSTDFHWLMWGTNVSEITGPGSIT